MNKKKDTSSEQSQESASVLSDANIVRFCPITGCKIDWKYNKYLNVFSATIKNNYSPYVCKFYYYRPDKMEYAVQLSFPGDSVIAHSTDLKQAFLAAEEKQKKAIKSFQRGVAAHALLAGTISHEEYCKI